MLAYKIISDKLNYVLVLFWDKVKVRSYHLLFSFNTSTIKDSITTKLYNSLVYLLKVSERLHSRDVSKKINQVPVGQKNSFAFSSK